MKKVLFLSLIAFAMCADSGNSHTCNWAECPINDLGEVVLRNPETDTECYIKTHSIHPDWSYEQIESFVFSNPDIIVTVTR